MEELTQQELDERVALLRKFRSLLEQQRNKFREYLRNKESIKIITRKYVSEDEALHEIKNEVTFKTKYVFTDSSIPDTKMTIKSNLPAQTFSLS